MWTWKRFGGYEVSTQGDKRFSAFSAIMLDGRSIECHYQCDVKGYDVGGTNWRLGKGKPPIDRSKKLWKEYLDLWIEWAKCNPVLIEELRKLTDANKCLSDKFASTPINQAAALACILNFGE